MNDAENLITDVLVRHEPLNGGDSCDCGWWWDQAEGRNHPEHVAAEIVKALGGLTRAWAAVLPDDSYFGPYHEAYEIRRNEARQQAEADVAEYEDSALKSRWVSGWSEVQP
ncbi:hypothetical protein BTO20_11295 [Mycobacterium dioxanotrophicus]|uniref:Uncharacterized protein n=1 Tax=Mycobacterium dioxanotrophicus TaxID=482462 RepID=A0A1Y0C1N4_9MYCO|nr:hypothetical protein [Mycobacterium dioxanotrophicus]ART69091.1 hypothetical protein BTO20_11295 [Mycobacterium dioxanotrophicus]